MRPSIPLGFILISGLIISGCENRSTEKPPAVPESRTQAVPAPPAAEQAPEKKISARAEMKPTEGQQAKGVVSFVQEPEGVRVTAELEGLSPGLHGFHVHEKGDCSAPDASSAGGHFSPSGSPHGNPDNPPELRHAGDLGNIEAGADGRGIYERVDPVLRLSGSDSIIGKAVLVHAGPDDMTSQPAGNSGPRVACGIIESP